MGRILARSGYRLSSSALTNGPISTPLMVTFSISPWMSTSTSSHLDPLQVHPAEAGLAQVDGAKLGAAEVNAFETRALKILTKELSHARKP
jgi:hypothetical protein